MSRTYGDAVAALNTLQSNFAVVDAIRKSKRAMNEMAIPEMIGWCKRIGYTPSDLNRLYPIHIAGTKGKGSTSAFTSSILTQFIGSHSHLLGRPLSKIGLYTSPHLRFVRERIQINNTPLTEEQFAKYFFETWDRLERSAETEGKTPSDPGTKPVYFRFLTLMAFHVYMSEGVDGVVLECGVGGRYDSTNIIEAPAVAAITKLGIDHVGMLGETIEEIAWHKAGIMKKGTCFTVASQKKEAMNVLNKVAEEVQCELIEVQTKQQYLDGTIKLGLKGDFQKENASLAICAAELWLQKMKVKCDQIEGSARLKKGVEVVKWPGRCETRLEPGLKWGIDGAHTLDSIEFAARWFAQESVDVRGSFTKGPRCLIFNQQTRDADALANALHDTLASAFGQDKPFTHAIFCTNTTFRNTGFRPDLVSLNTNASDVSELKVQNQLAETWKGIDPHTTVRVVKTIEEAVEIVRGLVGTGEEKSDVTALVTGSLHLVGGFLEVIEST